MLASFVLLAQAVTTTDNTTVVNSPTGFGSHGIIWTLLIGFVVGVIAKFLTPGRDPAGCFVTSIIGIVGALLARFVGGMLGMYGNGAGPGLIASVIGAIIVLAIYHAIFRPGSRGGSGPTV